MPLLLMVIFAVAAAVFAALYFLLRHSIRQATRALREIDEEADTNRQLLLHSPDGELELLLLEVNALLGKRQKERIGYEHKEQEFRRQIANISHDLRTPLTSVLGYTELLEDASATAQEKEEYREIISRRARVLQTMVASFYDLSRLEAGEYPLHPEPVSLYDILCDLLAAYYPNFIDRGFAVEVSLDKNLPRVSLDKNALTRILTNLLQNALKHGEGTLAVTLAGEEAAAIVRLRNHAPGMTQKDAAHVFERFYTADQTRTGQNTGLGLTRAHQFAQEMGCRLTSLLIEEDFQIELRIPLML